MIFFFKNITFEIAETMEKTWNFQLQQIFEIKYKLSLEYLFVLPTNRKSLSGILS